MKDLRITNASVPVKLFASILSCMTGLVYLVLLSRIFIETQMNPERIMKAYGSMEYIEVTSHAVEYLPFYVFFIFLVPVSLFMLTSFSDKLKSFFAVVPFIFIVLDIASMYLIPYLSSKFAYVLWGAGTVLACSFFAMFLMNMYDMWLRKPAEQAK